MLTVAEDLEIAVLAAQGWSISAIARRIGHDRKTVRVRLHGDAADHRRRARRDAFEPFLGYVGARLAHDADLPAAALYQELVERGFTRSYSTLTARLRSLGLRQFKLHDAEAPSANDDVVTAPQTSDPGCAPTVILPAEAPALTPCAAPALLSILLKAAERAGVP